MINHIKPADYVLLFKNIGKEYHVICYVDGLHSQSLAKYGTKYWKLIPVKYGIKSNKFTVANIPEEELELVTDPIEISRLDKIRVFKQ